MNDVSKILSVLAVLGVTAIAWTGQPTVEPDLVQPVGLVEIFTAANPLMPFSKGTAVFVSDKQMLTATHVVDAITKDTINKVRTENGDIYNIVDVKKSNDMDIGIITVDRPYKGYIPTVSCEAQKTGTELTAVGNPLIMEFIESNLRVAGGRPSRYALHETPPDAKEETKAKPDDPKPEPPKPEDKNKRKRFAVIPPDKIGPKKTPAKPANLTGTAFFQGIALPGGSGSPLYDKDGKIVGVVAITVVDGNSGSYSGLGMFVETSKACKFLQDNIKR